MITGEDLGSVLAAWLAVIQDVSLMKVGAGLLLVFQFYVAYRRLRLINKEERRQDDEKERSK